MVFLVKYNNDLLSTCEIKFLNNIILYGQIEQVFACSLIVSLLFKMALPPDSQWFPVLLIMPTLVT